MREWRRITPRVFAERETLPSPRELQERGERTCAEVYGHMYERLRMNIRELHPLLDDWIILDGQGKVLSRPALDLRRRELCIVAACAATAQHRQLQSHLRGARNAGVTEGMIPQTLDSLDGATRLWNRIRHDVH